MPIAMRIYVVTNRLDINLKICTDLRSECWEIVHLYDESELREVVDCDFSSCILVYISDSSAKELATIDGIRKSFPLAQLIALSSQWEVPAVVQAIKLGAFEVCEYPSADQRLLNAIRQAIQTERQDSRKLHELIPRSILERLTSGEARILSLLVEGRTTKEVGASLDVSVRTIHYRKKSILQKLGVQNRSEAIELIRVMQGSLATF